MRLKTPGKIIIFLLICGAAFGGYRLYTNSSGNDPLADLIPGKRGVASDVPIKADLPDAPVSSTASLPTTTMPTADPASVGGPEVRFLVWAWNSQMGMMFANGGAETTEGSLMAEKGVKLRLTRQDDVAKMQEALVAFATELHSGVKQPKKGTHFIAIMGDGSAAFLKGINDALDRLGGEYHAKIVGSCGYSRGEDKFMGPQEWKDNPSKAKGGVVSGYLRDGDWNIALKWLGDNGLKNNPDETTYDPDALNWVAANDYIDAVEKFVSGYSEDRDIVRNGKKTGKRKRITVQGTVTWTPGDVTAAKEKGGIVSIVSTKEYASQMPNVIIGIDKWMKENPDTVANMLHAITDGGDMVKASSAALDRAAAISAQVYGEQDAAYWKKYYRGVVEPDKLGIPVELGGSSVNNLQDNLLLFGMLPGSANVFAATYTVFGDIVVDQYPELVPNYPKVEQILDTRYLKMVQSKIKASGDSRVATSAPKTAPVSKPITSVISRKSWNIPFASGKATFSPGARSQLERLRRDLLVASDTVVEIHGHTDARGGVDANQALSEARAFAVQNWLTANFPYNFPKGRVRVFAHGQTQPVAPNTSEAGRAKNRRVEIVIGVTK